VSVNARRLLVAVATLLGPVPRARAEASPPLDPAAGSLPSPDEIPGSDLAPDPSTQRPVFGTAIVDGELGTNYVSGVKLALFGTPFPGVSLGGSAFFAPLVLVPSVCRETCTGPYTVLGRAMAELRLGTPYADYRKGLGWFGVGAGVTYEAGLALDPSPVASLAVGGDIRMTHSLWIELSPKFTYAQMIGPGSAYSHATFTGGLELGVRVDFTH
jgi:hypothetical protein